MQVAKLALALQSRNEARKKLQDQASCMATLTEKGFPGIPAKTEEPDEASALAQEMAISPPVRLSHLFLCLYWQKYPVLAHERLKAILTANSFQVFAAVALNNWFIALYPAWHQAKPHAYIPLKKPLSCSTKVSNCSKTTPTE